MNSSLMIRRLAGRKVTLICISLIKKGYSLLRIAGKAAIFAMPKVSSASAY